MDITDKYRSTLVDSNTADGTKETVFDGGNVETHPLDKLGIFIVDCINNLKTISSVLFEKLYQWTFESKDNLLEQEDWEILFCLLYTQNYKQKLDGCVIYRDGKFHCNYEPGMKLPKEEAILITSTLKIWQQESRRAVRKIACIIIEIFSNIENKSGDIFKLFSKDDALLNVTVKYKNFIKSHDNIQCLVNLRNALGNVENMKLELLVSAY